jgi:hypothetical protein
MNRSLPPRRTSYLPQSTSQRLNMYALAAGAAGVSVLAMAPPASAEIIYTPAHQAILGPRGTFRLDLNHDGIADFGITNTTNFNTDQAFSNLFVNCMPGNAVAGTWVYFGFPPNARAFNPGTQIGPSERFFKSADAKMVSYYYGGGGHSAHGNWINLTDRYLGLAFKIDGRTHFGWARFTVKIVHQKLTIAAELTGYAYETEADTPIIAGQTSGTYAEKKPQALSTPAPAPAAGAASLGMLAMGSPAMSMWRREETLDAMN